MRLVQLLAFTKILAAAGDFEQEVTGITYDSRQVSPGTLFVALPGLKTDGHYFIKDAVARGARAVIISDPAFAAENYTWAQVPDARNALSDLACAFYDNPSLSLNMIGVTGTNGKTTTTNLIATVLEDAGHHPALIGTIHNRLGREIYPVHHTTPEAPDLQELFRTFLNKGADYVVMEVSSHALEMQRVRGTEFDVTVFTNLTQDHLDFHQTMEEYLAAKGKLFSGLGKGVKERRKFAILNSDDPYVEQLMELSSVPIITYGVKKNADVKAEQVIVTDKGVSFVLRYTNQTLPVNLKLTGIFNVYNALAAIAVGLVEGVPAEAIIKSLEKVAGVPGRFERVDGGQNFTVIVDYSHTPDSLENCLKTAREFAQGKIITVFGCGGDRDRTKRPLMGEVAGRYSDYCIVTSDNPRSEEPRAIIDEIIPGLARVKGENYYTAITDRKEAIFQAIRRARAGDAVIIAGKGHEDYQIIGTKVLDFDDRLVARQALEEIGALCTD